MDNYQISRDRAQAYFLEAQKDLSAWNLPQDGRFLCLAFLGQPYRIDCQTGGIYRQDGTQADFQEALSIYDLLCHEGDRKEVNGVFAPVNSLKGLPPGTGVATDFYSKTAAFFDARPEALIRACRELGGRQVNMGDIGFRFSVLGPLDVILKFYHGDEDFPASLTLLWEENTLGFVFYETVFYIAGCLLRLISEKMDGE